VVPDDHRAREIAAVLDLSWVHAKLARYYPHLGRPSIDPVLMIRMLIVGYVFANYGAAPFIEQALGETVTRCAGFGESADLAERDNSHTMEGARSTAGLAREHFTGAG
jgi:hypothetical protein